MHESSQEEKKVIFIVLGLLLLGITLAGVKRYYPKSANNIIYVSVNANSSNPETSQPEESIRINTASTVELIKLSGIGEVIALRIVDYRENNGPFKTKQQLLSVKGIGAKKLQKIKNQITLK